MKLKLYEVASGEGVEYEAMQRLYEEREMHGEIPAVPAISDQVSDMQVKKEMTQLWPPADCNHEWPWVGTTQLSPEHHR